MLERPSGEPIAATICTPHAWVRGLVDLGRMRRLSEVLNHPAVEFQLLLDAEVLPAGGHAWPVPQPRLYLRKAEMLFVYPTTAAAQAPPPAGLPVQKLPVAVGVYVGDYHVQGRIHLADRVPWEQFLSVLRDRFLSLTEATITRAAGEPVATVDYLAINREHLLALYPRE